MTYSVVGMGAVGGFYGGRLAHAGREVHFLSHSDYQYVLQHGLRVDSCDGDFLLPHINAYGSSADMPKTDVIIVGLKTVNNHLLPDLLGPILHDDSIVLLIQNGIGIEEDLQKVFPRLHIVAGVAFICSSKVEPGHIKHHDLGRINLGNYSCPADDFARLLADFQDAGFQAAEVPYLEARWRKAVWNMPFNGMTVALNTSTDKLLRNPATRQLIKDQMLEVIGAANALGVDKLTPAFADQMIKSTDEMVPYSPSMKLDFDYHRPMEIPYLYTRPIEEAKKVGFEMPKLAMLEAELKFIAAGL
ncbi:MAG: 2-dehydropantoate 2-reductase [Prevotella sp.]|nr:2-dehydropantoate 2-reductase [Prevotella sp.]